MQIDALIKYPSYPTMFRAAIRLVYGQRKSGRGRVELGMSQPELSICIQMAREYTAQEHDDMRLSWS